MDFFTIPKTFDTILEMFFKYKMNCFIFLHSSQTQPAPISFPEPSLPSSSGGGMGNEIHTLGDHFGIKRSTMTGFFDFRFHCACHGRMLYPSLSQRISFTVRLNKGNEGSGNEIEQAPILQLYCCPLGWVL